MNMRNCFSPNPSLPSKLGRFFVTVALLAILSGSPCWADENRTVLDWREQVAGEAPTLPADQVRYHVRGDMSSVVVGPETSPPTPFVNGEQGLFSKPLDGGESNSSTSLTVNPFWLQDSPPQGWVEFEIALLAKGMISVHLGADANESVNPAFPVYDGSWLFRVTYRGESTANVDGYTAAPESSLEIWPKILDEQMHTVRFAWNWEGDSPGISLFIDGEPCFGPDNEPAFLPVEPGRIQHGVDRLWISISDGYLGKITASE